MIRHFDEEDEEVTMFDKSSLLKYPSSTKPPSKCQKLVKTCFLCAAFFGMGLAIAIPGPTLKFLEQQNNVDTDRISYIYPARSVGYLLGSIMSGILFDKLSSKDKLLTALGLIITAVGLTIAPWVQTLSLLCLCLSVSGVAMGFLDTGGNVMCLKIWNKDSGPYLQSLHFSFGVGALVAPLIAAPFFTALPANSTPALLVTPTTTLACVHFIDKRLNQVANSSIVDMSKLEIITNMTLNSTESNSTFSTSSTISFNGTSSTDPVLIMKPQSSGNSLSGDQSARSGDDLAKPVAKKKQAILLEIVQSAMNSNNTSEANHSSALSTNSVSRTSSSLRTVIPSVNNSMTSPVSTSTTKIPSGSTNETTSAIVTATNETDQMTSTAGSAPVRTSQLDTKTSIATTTTNAVSSTAGKSTNKADVSTTTAGSATPIAAQTTTKHDVATTTNGSATSTDGAAITATSVYTSAPLGSDNDSNTTAASRIPTPNVKYSYMIIGAVLLVCAASFGIMECCSSEDSKDSRADNNFDEDNEPKAEQNMGFKVKIMVGAFLFFMLYVGTEISFGQFISSYGQVTYRMSEKEGAFLTSIFWTAFTVGRGLSIPLSKCLSPTALISVSLMLSLSSAIGLVAIAIILPSVHILWVLTACCGIGCAAIFPTGVLWIEQRITVCAKMATVFVVGSAFGEMWIPAVVGYYFIHLGPISLMCMTLGCIIGCAFIFFAMQCVARAPQNQYKRVSTTLPADTIAMEELDFSDSETDTEPIIQRSNSINKSYSQ